MKLLDMYNKWKARSKSIERPLADSMTTASGSGKTEQLA